MYFWVMGLLFLFFDNVLMYFVFFNIVGGDVCMLMSEGVFMLVVIFVVVVFMGVNIYIGNVFNLMVKVIVESCGLWMLSFFGYMLWFICIFVLIFVLMIFVFFC